jgi:hypothetical protein
MRTGNPIWKTRGPAFGQTLWPDRGVAPPTSPPHPRQEISRNQIRAPVFWRVVRPEPFLPLGTLGPGSTAQTQRRVT